MAQCETKRVNLKSVIGNAFFLKGFQDAMNGIGLYEKYDSIPLNKQFNYERGRQFYFAAGKIRIKQGRGVSRDAVEIYKMLRANNYVL